MKSALFSLTAAIAILIPSSLSAQIINIDFLSQRTTSAFVEPVASNYSGPGAAGGGIFFNGLLALNNLPVDNPSDNINVSGTNLVDSNNAGTTVGFSVTDVGADNSGVFSNGILNGAYIFLHSSNNTQSSATFTISGLTSPFVSLYFYSSNDSGELGDPTLTLSGGTQTTYTGSITPFTSSNTFEFTNVPVIDGEVTGSFGQSRVLIIGGLTVEETPEPSTWALMGLGAGLLLWRLRRSGSTI